MDLPDDINELRRIVRKRHAAATNKISRTRRNKDVEIGGTKYDPRRDPSRIKNYTRAQLRSYMNELDAFTSRRTGYVAGAQGAPIPADLWRKYKAAENRYNAKGRRRDEAIAGIKLPGQDMTVAQRATMMKPNILRAGGEASNKPFAPVSRKPSNVPGVAELNALIRSMNKKNSRNYLPGYIKKQRQQAEKMMHTIGVGDQVKDLRKLSDDQFDTLFNDTSFAGDLGMKYGYMSMLDKGNKNAAHDAVMETSEHDIAEQITWAKNLPARKTTRR